MKHVITITKQDFQQVDYIDNQDCALARALKRQFPESTFINVVGYSFSIELNGKTITRDFESCELESSHHTNDLSQIILDYCYLDFRTKKAHDFEEVVFNFITH